MLKAKNKDTDLGLCCSHLTKSVFCDKARVPNDSMQKKWKKSHLVQLNLDFMDWKTVCSIYSKSSKNLSVYFFKTLTNSN